MSFERRFLFTLVLAAVLFAPLSAGGPPLYADSQLPAAGIALEPVLADFVNSINDESTIDGNPIQATRLMEDVLPNGRLTLLVRFTTPSVLEVVDAYETAPGRGAVPMAVGTVEQVHRSIIADQGTQVSAMEAMGVNVIGTFQVTMNGVHVHATPEQLVALARMPGVAGISRAPILELHNEDVRQHLRADEVAAELGFDGTGTTIAIIDTGIDYTHAAFGGPGTVEAFEENDPEIVEPGTFPTDKVVGGYDFAGTRYSPRCPPSPPEGVICTPAQPDEDPLDDASTSQTSGHGTHVASTAAGEATDDVAPGMAPGARLVALKVFGSPVNVPASTDVSSQAVEWAAAHNLYLDDPESELVPGFRPDTKIDVINMSLGSAYGSGASEADRIIQAAVDAGITVVISAGNNGNTPYITGSPSTAQQALTVSNTHARNTKGGMVVAVWTGDAGEERLEEIATTDDGWAGDLEETGDLTAELAWYGLACNDAEGAPSEPDQDVTERIALIERGSCTFVEKVTNAEAMGAVGALIFNNQNPMGGMAGVCEDCPEIPVLMINRQPGVDLRDLVEDGTSVMVTLSKGIIPWLTDTIAPGSSRGPARFSGMIKPNVSAPGQSTKAAQSGSGTLGHELSGTSMSGPAVAGIAALLWQRNNEQALGLEALDISALIMNYANPIIRNDRNDTGPLLGSTRQGAGLVDGLASAMAQTVVRSDVGIAELSFADVHVTETLTTITRGISVTNLSGSVKTYAFDTSFFFENDEGKGVTIETPDSVSVPGGETVAVDIDLVVDPEGLRDWNGYGPFVISEERESALQELEIDGFVHLIEVDEAGEVVAEGDAPSVLFHVIPRRHTCVTQVTHDDFVLTSANPEAPHIWQNSCQSEAQIRPHYLAGVDALESETNPDHPAELDLGAIGIDTGIADVRQADGTVRQEQIVVFTVATAGPRRTIFDGLFDIYIDTNGDGKLDRTVRQWPLSNLVPTAPAGVFVVISAPLAPGTLLPVITPQTISGGYYVQFDINESVTSLAVPLAALSDAWDLDSGDVSFEFGVALRDGMNDYEVTDTFLGEDMAPDDLVDGGRFTYSQKANACLMAEGRASDGTSVNLIGQVAGPIPNGSANAPLKLTCEPEGTMEVGILSEYRSNVPDTRAWDVRQGLVVSLTPIFLPYTSHTHVLLAEEEEPSARMRVAHASPGGPAVDVWLNEELVVEDVPYATVGEYLEVNGGEHHVSVTAAGTTEPALIDTTVELIGGLDYTFIVAGTPDAIELLLFTDDNSEPEDGMAHLRAIHLVPDGGAMEFAFVDGQIFPEPLVYKSQSEYVALSAGTFDVSVTSLDDATVLDFTDLELADGGVYTFFLVGYADGMEPAIEGLLTTDAIYIDGGN